MSHVLDLSYFILQVLSEILDRNIKADSFKKLLLTIPIDAFTDNKSLYRNVHSATMADEHRLKEMTLQLLNKRYYIMSYKVLHGCLLKNT